MKRTLILGLVVIAAVGAYLVFKKGPAGQESSDVQASPTGQYQLVVIADNVTLTHSGQKAVKVQGTVTVAEGDTVTTSVTGRARLRWPNGTLTTIEEDSQVVINAIADGGSKSRLDLVFGDIWSKVERVLGTGEYYEVQTQDTVAAVRGTIFRTTYRNRLTRVQTIERTVRVFIRGADGKPDETTGTTVEESMNVTLDRDASGARRFNKHRLNSIELRDRILDRIKRENNLTDDQMLPTPKASPSTTLKPSILPTPTPRPSALPTVSVSVSPKVTANPSSTSTPTPVPTPLPVKVISIIHRIVTLGTPGEDEFILNGENFIEGRNTSRISQVLIGTTPAANIGISDGFSAFIKPAQMPDGVYDVTVITTDGKTITLSAAVTIQ